MISTRTLLNWWRLRLTTYGPAGLGSFRSYQLLFVFPRTITLKLETWRRPHTADRLGRTPEKPASRPKPRRCLSTYRVYPSPQGRGQDVQCQLHQGHAGHHIHYGKVSLWPVQLAAWSRTSES